MTNYKTLLSEKEFLKVKRRAMLLSGTHIESIFYNKRDLLFKSRSGTDPRLFWYQTFRLLDIVDLDLSKFDFRALDELIRNSQLKVHCFTEENLVLTERGYVSIKEVNVGDMVFTHTGELKKVIRKYENKASEVITVRVGSSKKDIIRCTPNHKFLTLNGWEEVGVLNVGTTLVMPKLRLEVLDSLFSRVADCKGHFDESLTHLKGGGQYTPRLQEVLKREQGDFVVYNLEVEGDHSYIVNGVAVHNCTCISETTLLKTPQGIKPLSEISEGDYVLNEWNTYSRVMGILESSYDDDKYEIQAEGCESLYITGSHKIKTSKGMIPVKDLNYNSKLAILPDNDIPITNKSGCLFEWSRLKRKRVIKDNLRYYDISLLSDPHTYRANNYIVSNCPAFLYWGFKYKAWKNGYGLEKENRYPRVRNPLLRGYVCKHLYQCAQVFPFLSKELTKKFIDQYPKVENTGSDDTVEDSYERRNSGLIVPKKRIIKVFGTKPNYPEI